MQMLSVRCLEKIYVPPYNQNAFYICDNLDGWISTEGSHCNFSQFECNVSILAVWAAKCTHLVCQRVLSVFSLIYFQVIYIYVNYHCFLTFPSLYYRQNTEFNHMQSDAPERHSRYRNIQKQDIQKLKILKINFYFFIPKFFIMNCQHQRREGLLRHSSK